MVTVINESDVQKSQKVTKQPDTAIGAANTEVAASSAHSVDCTSKNASTAATAPPSRVNHITHNTQIRPIPQQNPHNLAQYYPHHGYTKPNSIHLNSNNKVAGAFAHPPSYPINAQMHPQNSNAETNAKKQAQSHHSQVNNATVAQPIQNTGPKVTSNKKVSNEVRTLISAPNASDVAHGLEAPPASHHGNDVYRSVLDKYYKRYPKSSPKEKLKCAKLIFHEITSQKPIGGRFLRYNSSRKGWEEMTTKESVDYTLRILHDTEERQRKANEKLKRVANANGNSVQKKIVEKKRKLNESKKSEITRNVVTVNETENDTTGNSSGKTSEMTAENKNKNKSPAKIREETIARDSQSVSQKNTVPVWEGNKIENSTPIEFKSRYCDKCLGTGLLPVPPQLLHLTNTSSSMAVESPVSAPLQSHHTTQRTSCDEVKIVRDNANTCLDSEGNTVWASHIQTIERKFGIPANKSLTYPERIQKIEEHAKMKNKKVLFEQLLNPEVMQGQNFVKMLEQAEKKWGVNVPDGYNYAQRVELIEKTAFNFTARLQVWL